MVFLDQTIVSVALPTMQRDLNASTAEIQWVINAFLLSLAAFVAAGGRLGDMYGRRRAFVTGAAMFVSFSALCGFAPNEAVIIIGRIGQGIGGALMIPATQAIVTTVFGPRERGKALGILVGISSVFLSAGPLLGGVITQGISWRWIFFVNLPIGIAAIVMALRYAPESRAERRSRFDFRGFALLATSLTALTLALTFGDQWGWGSAPVLGLFAGAADRWHAVRDRRVADRRAAAEPVAVPPAPVHRRQRAVICLQFALTGLTVYGVIFEQNVLGYDPIMAGLLFLPATLPVLFVAPISGRLADRVGARIPATVGMLMVAAGFAEIALLAERQEFGLLLPGYLLFGSGVALVMTPMNTAALNSVPAAQRGAGSGLLSTTRQIGGSVGIAIFGAVLAGVQGSTFTRTVEAAGISPTDAARLESLAAGAGSAPQHVDGLTTTQLDELTRAANDAFVAGFTQAMTVATAVALLGALIVFLTIRRTAAVDDPDAPIATAAAGSRIRSGRVRVRCRPARPHRVMRTRHPPRRASSRARPTLPRDT